MNTISTIRGTASISDDAEWQRLRDALLSMASTPFHEPAMVRERLLSTDAEALRIDRVSLWLFEPDHSAIACAALYETGKGVSQPAMRIPSSAAPAYFASLQGLLTLAVADAQLDPRTQQLNEPYLVPLGIGAMLDVPVRQFGELIGVLCHEHIGEAREWLDTERIFAAAVGALCSQAMEFEKLRRAEQERDHALFYDQLTGLPNRALFLDRIESAKAGCDAALLVLDIDGFGEFSKAYGPGTGDSLLREAAARISPGGCTDLAGRMGNDEFALLLPGEQGVASATGRAASLQAAMRRPMAIDGREFHVSFSIGLLPSVRHYAAAADALRDAEIAQNLASHAGRDCIRIFEIGMEETIRARLELEADIRRGIDASEFLFFLQPIFSRSGQLKGGEALLRWQHPIRGLLAPSAFLEVAELAGLLPDLQWPLLAGLLESVAGWRRARCPDFVIAINLSSVQLGMPDFPDALVAAISMAGLPADAISLEITENSLLANEGRDLPAINRLAAAGIAISLDDFGTGYASITHLAQLPLSIVKIDRSFVERATSDTRYAAIIATLVSLAHTLSLRVVAEGVENEAQRKLLDGGGCDLMQGFHLGRPQAPRDFTARWLA